MTLSLSLSLHDSLALGEVELGLSQSQNDDIDNDARRKQEIQRLPLFLRILSLARPLTAVPTFEDNETNGIDDELVHRTVERLEDVAATYSMAEEVDVVTSYLAPNMSRKIGQLPPLRKTKEGEWDTKDLAAVAKNPRSSSKRKRTLSEGIPDGDEDDAIRDSSADDEDADASGEEGDAAGADGKKRKGPKIRKTILDRRESEIAAAEDSQEATFVKTLSELASLVVAALAPLEESSNGGDAGGGGTAEGTETEGRSKGRLSLTVDDSILNESTAGSGGAMEGSDLGATVAAIMCNASVLQSRHVAYALCRAATPQAAYLMTRIGANCPASVPSLLLGCLDAYSLAVAEKGSHIPIVKAAKQGVKALAQLSASERARVLNKLQSTNTMLDLQLKLAMELPDSTTACCFLLRRLPKELMTATSESQTGVGGRNRKQPNQTPGDRSSSSDHRMDHAAFGSEKSENLVQALLIDGQNTYREVLSFLSKELSSLASMQPKDIAIGKLSLMLKACCWTLLVPLKVPSAKLHDTISLLGNKLLPGIRQLSTKLCDYCVSRRCNESDDLPKSSSFDGVMKVLVSTTILTMDRVLSLIAEESSQYSSHQSTIESLIKVINELKGDSGVSETAQAFATKVQHAISDGSVSVLLALLMSDWVGGVPLRHGQLDRVLPSLDHGMKELADLWNKTSGDGSESTLDLDSRAALLLLELNDEKSASSVSTDKRSEIEDVLKSILCSTNNSHAFIQRAAVLQFVVQATKFLCAGREMVVPLIMVPQLELLGTRLKVETTEDKLDDIQSRFLLQLLHAMEFLEQNPDSPFSIDPRTLPVKEAILLAEFLEKRSNGFLLEQIVSYVTKQCPEVLELSYPVWTQKRQHSMRKSHSALLPRSDMMNLLRRTIESYLVKSPTECNKDKGGSELERIFLDTRLQTSDSDLACTVVSAMLSSPHQPPLSLTYPKLCRDPLILLKCPFKVWSCTGLRRTGLSILCLLLESNEAIVWSDAPTEESAEEYLAARDALVVRCLVTAMSGSENDVSPLPHCSMTTSIIRLLTRRRKGIVALLVKQGLPEESLDWMVEFVPEVMNDSQDMLQMLSDQRSLTPAERLVAADAVLKIAIVQGQSNEVDAANMAYIALTQLCDALFLVAGPIGVPVNAVLEDNSGLDVTHRSRKAAFRMLQTLLTVRGRRTNLRKECELALNKLAGLCKNESAVSGVSGTVAGRRNALLKEIFDAATKATNAMGSCVGHQSVAA
ncbi:unnamed protein product [Cylindrotheca closterium]|uniref:Uncharacterized protein n=1 Tax=Cylindrotheca closterium TaxID=2856 RepID=A0AAD2FV93_9STRA|nr:unnamed protein product [Cylindrotheca closterium]